MSISFSLIPSLLRTPGRYVEFDSSRAIRGLPGIPFKVLMIGQKLSAGTQAVNTLVRVGSADVARTLFGEGSMLHAMAVRYFANNATNELWAIALADGGGAAAAAGDITFSGSATSAGTLYLYVAGRRITVAITAAMANSAIATAVAAAVTAVTDLPVTAAVDGGDPTQVNFTARHAGVAGNSIDIRLNYYDGGEALPPGQGATITPMAAGSVNPDVTAAVTAMGDEWFNVIAMPYTDTTALNALEVELASRWGPMRAIEGQAIAAHVAAHGALLTLGNGRNSPHTSIMGVYGSPTPPWEWAGALAGVAAFYAQQDPARPFQTLPLVGVLAPPEGDRFTQSERNLLLLDGIATFTVDLDGTVRIDRLITTYQTNAAGAPDPSYLDANTLFTLGYLRYTFRNHFATRYPRHKVGDDGNRFGAGQAIITPKIGRAECITLFRQWEERALVENVDQFKADLVVERNADDRNRLDFLLPPDLVNQLVVVGAQIQFRL